MFRKIITLWVPIMPLNGCRSVDSWKTTHSDSDGNSYDPSGWINVFWSFIIQLCQVTQHPSHDYSLDRKTFIFKVKNICIFLKHIYQFASEDIGSSIGVVWINVTASTERHPFMTYGLTESDYFPKHLPKSHIMDSMRGIKQWENFHVWVNYLGDYSKYLFY